MQLESWKGARSYRALQAMVKTLDFILSEMGSVAGGGAGGGGSFEPGSISVSVPSGALQMSPSILLTGYKGTLTYSELLFAEHIPSCKLDRNPLESGTKAQAFG